MIPSIDFSLTAPYISMLENVIFIEAEIPIKAVE